MGAITFLFSFLARKANDIIQAIFGWSITALFGRLPRRSQIMVTGALVLSLAWPLFVVGVFFPRAAAWAIALVPLHKLVGAGVLRVIWIVLAVVSPMLIGLLVWLAARERRGGVVRALLGGYPAALGFFIAFLVVAVTVPIIKVISIVRRWSDEHVFVMAHHDRYDEVVRSLTEACERAGFTPMVEDAPRHMVFATTIMRTFATASVAPFVGQKLQRIATNGLEMYVYPADLLIRGQSQKVAHVRAMFGRTKLDAHAYLVASDEGQRLQKELGTLTDIVSEVQALKLGTETLASQLQDIYARMIKSDIPYTDWVILDVIARRLERRMLGAGIVQREKLPIDAVQDHLGSRRGRTTRRDTPAWKPQLVPSR